MADGYIAQDGLVAEWTHDTFVGGQDKWVDGVNGHLITFVGDVPTNSERGVKFTESTTFSSSSIASHSISSETGMTFEYIGWLDSKTFKSSSNHPGCVLGVSPVAGAWSGIMLYGYDNTMTNSGGARGLTCEVAGVSGQDLKMPTQLTSEKMYHVVVTVFGKTVKMFVDSTEFSHTGVVLDGVKSGWPVNFNYVYNSEGAGRSSGSIYSIRVWDRSLTDEEIELLFKVSLSTQTPLYFKRNGKWEHAQRVMLKSDGKWKAISYKDFTVLSKLQHMGFVPVDLSQSQAS